MTRLVKLLPGMLRGQRGLTLVENLVAAAILAAIGLVFMQALDAAHRNVEILDIQLRAEMLARSQLEDIKEAAYDVNGNYPVTVEMPPQFTMRMTVTSPTCIGTADNCTSLDDLMGEPVTTIQEITVYVYHAGEAVISVACYKVDSE
jgi:type II secretory pathway pseudopilin PulG